MSCNNYSANSSPQVEFSGSVPGDSCFSTVTALFDLFKNSLVGVMPADYSTFIVSDTEPSASNRDKVWVSVDSANCRPNGIKLYLNGAWVDIGARYFSGVDTSSVANTITVTSMTPSVNWAETGHLYAIKMNQANTGPVTITISNGATTVYTAIPVKVYGATALSGLELLDDHVGLFYYDGTNFQLLNPRPSSSSGSSSGSASGFNLSFEDDTDGNGIPDQWNAYCANLATQTFTGSSGTDALAAPLAGTFTLDTATTNHGVKSAKFTCGSGAANGGGFIQTADFIPCDADGIIELSWWARASTAGIDCSAELLFYSAKSESSAFISKTVLWVDTAVGPNSYWFQLGGICKAPSTARYYKIRLIAGTLNNDVPGDVWFDDVQLNAPRFKAKLNFTDVVYALAGGAGNSQWKPTSTIIQAKVTCVGAGGSGYNTAISGGGGGGGTAISYVTVNPATTYEVVIGASGADSTFGGVVVGDAGTIGSAGAGGAAGTANTGNVTFNGEAGANPGALDGKGGSSMMGAGGTSRATYGPQVGQLYGGGGAGNSTPYPSGAQGIVIIEHA